MRPMVCILAALLALLRLALGASLLPAAAPPTGGAMDEGEVWFLVIRRDGLMSVLSSAPEATTGACVRLIIN